MIKGMSHFILYYLYSNSNVGTIEKKNERLTQIKQYTDDEAIWSKVDSIAFSQEELDKLLKSDYTEIYLCGEAFFVSNVCKAIKIIGINHPMIKIKDEEITSILGNDDIKFIEIRFDKSIPDKVVELYNEGKYDDTYKVCIKLSENSEGMGRAINILGGCYFKGGGVEQDYQKAIEYFEKAAKMEEETAITRLGICYLYGYGVEENPTEAIEYFRKALKKGDDNAMIILAGCYLEGLGVEVNPIKARELLEKASAQGNSDAKELLDEYF